MQKGQITLRVHISLALVSPLGTAVAAPMWLIDITCTESVALDIYSKHNFIHCLAGGSSIVHPSCLLVCITFLLLEQSVVTQQETSPPILNANREIKSISPLPALLLPSHTAHLSLISQLTTDRALKAFSFLSGCWGQIPTTI